MKRYSLFATASRPALDPTQPPIQRVPATISSGIKQSEREADQSFPSRAEVKNVWSYTATSQYDGAYKFSGLSHNKINNNKHSLRSKMKVYGGKTY
jgi:hypothetical protein